MITIAPMLFSILRIHGLPWITTSGSLVLLGIYYGFLTTLPLGPSQLLCIRTFLLEGEGAESEAPGTIARSGVVIAAVSGLALSQLLFFLSIYWPPLYIVWVKPHILTLLVLPYMFFYWYRIKQFERIGFVEITHPLYDPRVQGAFLDSFFLQALNPILLPNPVLTRLINLFLFRYSQSLTFVVGGMIGWLGGQITFILLIWLLVLRLERDTPTVYVALRRLVHRFFPPIVFALCLAYLGKAPIPVFSKTKELINIQGLRNQEPWPSVAFDTSLWNRPLRFARQYITDEDKDTVNQQKDMVDERNNIYYNKKRFSQYLFEACLSDGNRRLSHTYPQSLIEFRADLQACLDIPCISQQSENSIYHEWTTSKIIRRKQLYDALANRMHELDKGATIENVLNHKLASWTLAEEPVNKGLDPRLVNYMRVRSLPNETESPWKFGDFNLLASDSLSSQDTDSVNVLNNNKLREWIVNKSQQMGDTLLVPWESLNYESDFNLRTLLNSQSTNDKVSNISNLSWETFIDFYKLSTSPNQTVTGITSNWQKLWLCLQNLLQINIKWLTKQLKLSDQILDADKIAAFQEMHKRIPLWYVQEQTDIKEVQSRGYKSTDFRRRLIQGSIRARRRKVMIWNTFQTVPETPLLLRVRKTSNQVNSLLQLFRPDSSESTSNKQDVYAMRTAKRFGFQTAHVLRGPVLIIQSVFRKYVKLPLLIVFKNLGRLLLFQQPELNQDLSDWAREVYIYCSYDGVTEQSTSTMPDKWYLQGLQIRILFPFQLRPWHSSTQNILEGSSYLTMWGAETDVPFGEMKKHPYFWKPTFKAIGLIINHRLRKQSATIRKLFAPIYSAFEARLPINAVVSRSSQKDNEGLRDNLEKTLDPIKQIKTVDQLGISDQTVNQPKEQTLSNRQNRLSISVLNANSKTTSAELVGLSKSAQQQLAKYISIRQRFCMPPSIDNCILMQRSLLEKPPIQSIRKQHNVFQIKWISEKSWISIRYKLLQINCLFVQVKRRWIYVQRQISNLGIELVVLTKTQLRHIRTNVLQVISKLTRLLTHQMIQAVRGIVNIADHISAVSKKWTMNRHFNQDLHISDFIQHKDTFPLTQAYVLHKIWQTKLVNNSNLTSIWKAWKDSAHGLKNDLKSMLLAQGIFINEPAKLNLDDWNHWLQFVPCYTPFSNVWLNIAPDRWRSAVQLDFEHVDAFQKYLDQPNAQFDGDNLQNDLIYHKPLFDKAKKLSKRMKWNQIYRRCTGSLYDYGYLFTDTSRLTLQQIRKHLQGGKTYQTPIMPLYEAEEDDSGSQEIEWGFARARKGRLAPKLVLLQPRTDNLNINTIDEDKEDIDASDLIEIDQELDDESVSLSVEEQTNFPIVYIKKWRSQALRNRFNSIIKAARLSAIAQKSGINLDQNTSVSSNMQTDLLLFGKNILNSSNILFTKQIGNCRPKVIDDHIFMHSIISPILKYANSVTTNELVSLSRVLSVESRLQQHPFLIASLTPEDTLVPTISREFRVLECLDLEKGLYDRKAFRSTDLGRIKSFIQIQNKANHNYIIKRFLWPTHRLEDLACMNRFWLGIANQSRFTALRISMYPPLIE